LEWAQQVGGEVNQLEAAIPVSQTEMVTTMDIVTRMVAILLFMAAIEMACHLLLHKRNVDQHGDETEMRDLIPDFPQDLHRRNMLVMMVQEAIVLTDTDHDLVILIVGHLQEVGLADQALIHISPSTAPTVDEESEMIGPQEMTDLGTAGEMTETSVAMTETEKITEDSTTMNAVELEEHAVAVEALSLEIVIEFGNESRFLTGREIGSAIEIFIVDDLNLSGNFA
jgi:hypothetical protein